MSIKEQIVANLERVIDNLSDARMHCPACRRVFCCRGCSECRKVSEVLKRQQEEQQHAAGLTSKSG